MSQVCLVSTIDKWLAGKTVFQNKFLYVKWNVSFYTHSLSITAHVCDVKHSENIFRISSLFLSQDLSFPEISWSHNFLADKQTNQQTKQDKNISLAEVMITATIWIFISLQTVIKCLWSTEGAHPLCGTLSRRGLNPINLTYDPRPGPITASAFNRLSHYVW